MLRLHTVEGLRALRAVLRLPTDGVMMILFESKNPAAVAAVVQC